MPALAEFAVDSPLFSRNSNEDAEGVSFRCPPTPPTDGHQAVRVLLVGCGDELQSHLHQRLYAPHWNLRQAIGGASALAMLREEASELVLVASSLPDLDVREFEQLVRTQFRAIQVVSLSSVLESSPVNRQAAVTTAGSSAASPKPGCMTASFEVAPDKPSSAAAPTNWGGMVGTSAAMKSVFRTAALVARRDTTVLIGGESGTGKDLLARGIHSASVRARQPFVVINCAAIPETLLEAELFGHTKGAFTGATQSRTGRIHAAHGGTLFLDEIGELPLPMQSKILRFLEQGEVQRIGSTDMLRVDCRIIAATNIKLREHVKARQFREDLYYRLAVMPIEVPPLRERLSDLPALCAGFLERYSPGASLQPEALQILMTHDWPGNIRELRNVMERASLLSEGRPQILAGDIVL